MLDPTRRVLSPEQVRALLAEAAREPALYARVALVALAGARPREVEGLRRGDFDADGSRLRLGRGALERTVRVAPSAAKLLGEAAGRVAAGTRGCLLEPWSPVRLVQSVRGAARAAGVEAGVHELRQSAIAVVWEDGTPVQHIEAYFGVSRPAARRDLVPVRDGYDVGIADVLQEAFG
ncbi:tyrosine-type recombinase/integrase [Streptomyces taklimakanensis]|uniref:tyrosine-type recombinase/integrase n=1 Tax=Streptomyces taklimakanensis TaxID=2569853 RepID=UPI001390C9EE